MFHSLLDWTDAIDFVPFSLGADGETPLAQGVNIALDAIEQHKKVLREHGIPYTRPWLFILTDGAPTDTEEEWQATCSRVREAERDGKIEVFAVGVQGANMDILSMLAERPPLTLDGLHFRELFVWLSASLSQVTRSAPGTHVELAPTNSWASVKL